MRKQMTNLTNITRNSRISNYTANEGTYTCTHIHAYMSFDACTCVSVCIKCICVMCLCRLIKFELYNTKKLDSGRVFRQQQQDDRPLIPKDAVLSRVYRNCKHTGWARTGTFPSECIRTLSLFREASATSIDMENP